MGEDEPSPAPTKGDHYRFPDGTTEVVYAIEDGYVLTIREYQRREDFSRAVDPAEYVGVHDGVAALPDIEALDSPDE